MAHQGKTLRVLVSKARGYFFTSPKGLVSFRFLKTNHDFLENTTFSCFAVSSKHDICPEKT